MIHALREFLSKKFVLLGRVFAAFSVKEGKVYLVETVSRERARAINIAALYAISSSGTTLLNSIASRYVVYMHLEQILLKYSHVST